MNEKNCRQYAREIILILLILFSSFKISAQDALPDSLVSERLRTIEKLLTAGQPGAILWWNGWLAGYTAATIGQGIVGISADDINLRQDMFLGAATTLLGAAGQLITPMVPGYASDRLNLISEDTREARLQKLKKAEELFRESAFREKSGRSWKTHALAGVVNVSSGLITWLGFKRDVWAGVGNFALNTFITEAQIWTQPTRAMRDYENYCKKYKTEKKPVVMKREILWYVSSSPGGIKLKIVF